MARRKGTAARKPKRGTAPKAPPKNSSETSQAPHRRSSGRVSARINARRADRGIDRDSDSDGDSDGDGDPSGKIAESGTGSNAPPTCKECGKPTPRHDVRQCGACKAKSVLGIGLGDDDSTVIKTQTLVDGGDFSDSDSSDLDDYVSPRKLPKPQAAVQPDVEIVGVVFSKRRSGAASSRAEVRVASGAKGTTATRCGGGRRRGAAAVTAAESESSGGEESPNPPLRRSARKSAVKAKRKILTHKTGGAANGATKTGRPRKAQAKTRAETGGGRRGRRTTRAGLVASSERDDSGSLGVRLSQRIHGLTPEEPDDIVQADVMERLEANGKLEIAPVDVADLLRLSDSDDDCTAGHGPVLWRRLRAELSEKEIRGMVESYETTLRRIVDQKTTTRLSVRWHDPAENYIMKMEAKQKLDGRVFGDLTSNELKFLTPALSGMFAKGKPDGHLFCVAVLVPWLAERIVTDGYMINKKYNRRRAGGLSKEEFEARQEAHKAQFLDPDKWLIGDEETALERYNAIVMDPPFDPVVQSKIPGYGRGAVSRSGPLGEAEVAAVLEAGRMDLERMRRRHGAIITGEWSGTGTSPKKPPGRRARQRNSILVGSTETITSAESDTPIGIEVLIPPRTKAGGVANGRKAKRKRTRHGDDEDADEDAVADAMVVMVEEGEASGEPTPKRRRSLRVSAQAAES